ncbi:MAG TPA: TIGR04290 family methyltransferase [Tepidisphaeraceae bacterium]|jgi:tRNA (mo5U34)-methyltransferase
MHQATAEAENLIKVAPAKSALEKEIEALGPWFHNLHLPDGTQTCPDHWLGDFPSFKWAEVGNWLPKDLNGWTCLDIGCNAGFYSFELARRGATVLGIDVDERYLQQARWAAKQFDLQDRVMFERMQVYDLARRSKRFDLVLFMGVLYHLRYPMLGLDIVCQKVNRLMLFQTLTMPGTDVYEQTWNRTWNDRELLLQQGWPKMSFFEHGFAGDPTNWWAPNHAACEAMLRAAGMRVMQRPGHEFYLCEPDPQRPACIATWNCAEFQSATGTPHSPPGGDDGATA